MRDWTKNSLLLFFMLIFTSSKIYSQYSCATAISIGAGYSATGVTTDGTHNWITSATIGGCVGTSSYYTTGDAYMYTFSTGGNAEGYTINAMISTNNTYTIAGLFTSCSGTSISGCVDADRNTSSAPDKLLLGNCNLTANTTYYLVVSRNASSAGSGVLSYDFDYFTLKANNSAYDANDECASATSVDFSDAYSGITAACYTPSAQTHCWGSLDNDSWVVFTASATTVNFDYDLNNCSDPANGIQFAIYSSCGGTELAGSCELGVTGSGTYSVSGLTIGNTYKLRIDGWAGNVCEFNLTPSTGVATTPPNNICSDAEVIACGGSDVENIILANNTGAPAGCTGGGTPDKGVWYSFTGTGQNVTVSTDNANTNFDTQVNVYTGSCGSLTCVGGDDDSGTGTTSSYTFYAVNATVYYIYVDGDGAAEGQFELSISCANCDANAGAWD